MKALIPRSKKLDRACNEADLNKQLASLSMLDRDQLKHRWRMLYRSEPPPMVSRSLLQYAVAYGLQVAFWGGLKPAVIKVIEGYLDGKPPQINLIPVGTKLLREWKGKVHEVEIQAVGVFYQGTRYRSLSEVAKLISGIHRSGPQFFGLKAKSPIKVVARDKPNKTKNGTQKLSMKALQA